MFKKEKGMVINMKATEGKRLAAILGAYIGLFASYVLMPRLQPYIFLVGILIVAVYFAVLLLRENRRGIFMRKSVLVLLMTVSVIAASIRGAIFFEKTEMAANRYTNGNSYTAKAYVSEITYEENYGSCYEIQLISLNGRKTELGALLSLPYNGDFSVGDILVFESSFSAPEPEAAIYRKADGIFLSAEADSAEKIGEQGTDTPNVFESVRLFMKTNFERYIEKEEAGFATAIMTGNRDNVNAQVRLAFTRIGISHVLAVSGLHLSIMVGGLDFFCRCIGIPRKMKNILLIVCACLLACVCGLSASVIRAAIMLSFFYIADSIGEIGDSLTALFAAIFLIVVFRPLAVYDVGMWLSFLATLGIVLTAPIIPMIRNSDCPWLVRKILNFIISLIFVTISATFFTLPVVCIAFGGISLISPLANLIFIPLIQIVLYLLVILTVIGFLPSLALPIGRAAQFLISFVCDTAELLSDKKDIYVSLRYPFVSWMIGVLIIGVLTVLTIRKIRAAHLYTVFALCVVIYAGGFFTHTQTQRELTYTFLETDGKSDVMGIVSHGETVVIDISTGGYSVLGEAVDHIGDFYECEIDVLVLTHYHGYHVNSLRKLLGKIKVHKILLPEPTSEKEMDYYRDICGQLAGYVDVEVYAMDGTASTLRIGNAELILPETEYLERSSHPIVRFSASIGEKGFSYLGAGATETDFSDYVNSVVVFGSNGPSVRNIFDIEPLSDSELLIFANSSHADFADMDSVYGQIAFAENYNGWVKILFE